MLLLSVQHMDCMWSENTRAHIPLPLTPLPASIPRLQWTLDHPVLDNLVLALIRS
jgi:hypothetical protein